MLKEIAWTTITTTRDDFLKCIVQKKIEAFMTEWKIFFRQTIKSTHNALFSGRRSRQSTKRFIFYFFLKKFFLRTKVKGWSTLIFFFVLLSFVTNRKIYNCFPSPGWHNGTCKGSCLILFVHNIHLTSKYFCYFQGQSTSFALLWKNENHFSFLNFQSKIICRST